MNQVALNLVVLRTPDLEGAERFYACLGLHFTRHRHGNGPEHLSAELGSCVFELYPLVPGEPSAFGTRVGFSVPLLDAAIAALKDYPTALISPPKDSPWGRRVVLADPDGHRVEVIEQSPQ